MAIKIYSYGRSRTLDISMEAKGVCISSISMRGDRSTILRRGADEWTLLVFNGNPEDPNTITVRSACRLLASPQRATITSGYIHLDFDQSYLYVPKKLRLGHRDRVSFVLDLSQLQ